MGDGPSAGGGAFSAGAERRRDRRARFVDIRMLHRTASAVWTILMAPSRASDRGDGLFAASAGVRPVHQRSLAGRGRTEACRHGCAACSSLRPHAGASTLTIR